ncbi:MAG: hypothetical protein ABEK59_03120 [Halobacteria archaeon]
MDDDGDFVSNIISSPSGTASMFFKSELRTISSVYPSVYSFRTSDSGSLQNIEVVAAKNPGHLSERELHHGNTDEGVLNLTSEIDTCTTLITPGVIF